MGMRSRVVRPLLFLIRLLLRNLLPCLLCLVDTDISSGGTREGRVEALEILWHSAIL